MARAQVPESRFFSPLLQLHFLWKADDLGTSVPIPCCRSTRMEPHLLREAPFSISCSGGDTTCANHWIEAFIVSVNFLLNFNVSLCYGFLTTHLCFFDKFFLKFSIFAYI